ncbi:hypothetical protein AAHA92_33935 [Salvia divinorum]|uniref:Uncharacterized protein n=1 Tax=Salvia divinorum TaxID=28513 RepID=A0ABD1FJX5_SALDI
MTMIDYNPWGVNDGNPRSRNEPTRLGEGTSKFSSRVSDKFDRTKEKTKEAAKKVKIGASTSVKWIKVKCNNTSNSSGNKLT